MTELKLMQRSDFKKIIFFAFTFLFIYPVSIKSQQSETTSKNAMVVSADYYASKVGEEILKKGGNAIDATVATGFALAVTYPAAGNIGGGGFMVIHLNNGKNTTIDFRETAPSKSIPNMFLDKNGNFNPKLSQEGTTSAGVPGSVAGLIYAQEKYGLLKLKDVIQPAIDLAEEGFVLSESMAHSFNELLPEFKKYKSSYKKFNNGKHFKKGDLFKQPDLANTLKLIKVYGKDGFYKGKVAELIIKQVQSLGGIISLKDLENYSALEKAPVIGSYRGYEIVSMGPSSAGGIALIEMLNILENFKIHKYEHNTAQYIHKLVESMKFAYADRSKYLGDNNFVKVPSDVLTSKKYAFEIFKKIKKLSIPSSEISSKNLKITEGTQTTHYSVYDKYGNAVSTTTTINSWFGSKIVVDSAGFLLNNEMDDFSSKPGSPNQFGLTGGEANSIQPGKRMLSSMTPTIVLKLGKPFLILGSPGGSTIITAVLQVIMNCIDFNMDLNTAVNSPRIHHQWLPDKIDFEHNALSEKAKNELKDIGYKIGDERVLGNIQAILIDNKNNLIHGCSDRRRSGSALGY